MSELCTYREHGRRRTAHVHAHTHAHEHIQYIWCPRVSSLPAEATGAGRHLAPATYVVIQCSLYLLSVVCAEGVRALARGRSSTDLQREKVTHRTDPVFPDTVQRPLRRLGRVVLVSKDNAQLGHLQKADVDDPSLVIDILYLEGFRRAAASARRFH